MNLNSFVKRLIFNLLSFRHLTPKMVIKSINNTVTVIPENYFVIKRSRGNMVILWLNYQANS